MRILWLCNMTLPIISKQISYPISNAGGWIIGLANTLMMNENIELNVSFPITGETIEGNVGGIRYFGFRKKNLLKYSFDNERYFVELISRLNPSVVHIFGTEFPHTLEMINACERLNILNRTVISIQGLTSVCAHHYYADLPKKIINGYTLRDLIKCDNIKRQMKMFIKRGKYEIEAIKKTKYVIGRTDWDKACTEQINPNVKYYKCNETLRDSFYENTWDIDKCNKHTIFLSQANYPIKGFHYMLEAMPIILIKYPDTQIYTY